MAQPILNIENKQDSPKKLAYALGKPSGNFLFANELNIIVAAINTLGSMIRLTTRDIDLILGQNTKIALGVIDDSFVDVLNARAEFSLVPPVFITFTNEDVDYVYAFVGNADSYGLGTGSELVEANFVLVYRSDSVFNTEGNREVKFISGIQTLILEDRNKLLVDENGGGVFTIPANVHPVSTVLKIMGQDSIVKSEESINDSDPGTEFFIPFWAAVEVTKIIEGTWMLNYKIKELPVAPIIDNSVIKDSPNAVSGAGVWTAFYNLNYKSLSKPVIISDRNEYYFSDIETARTKVVAMGFINFHSDFYFEKKYYMWFDIGYTQTIVVNELFNAFGQDNDVSIQDESGFIAEMLGKAFQNNASENDTILKKCVFNGDNSLKSITGTGKFKIGELESNGYSAFEESTSEIEIGTAIFTGTDALKNRNPRKGSKVSIKHLKSTGTNFCANPKGRFDIGFCEDTIGFTDAFIGGSNRSWIHLPQSMHHDITQGDVIRANIAAVNSDNTVIYE